MKSNSLQMPADSDAVRQVDLLTRREIEARFLAPLIQAYAQEVGLERSKEIANEAIQSIAYAQGCRLAEALGGCSLSQFAQTIAGWQKDGALKIEMLVQNEAQLHFNVVHCRYAELYRTLGIPELGKIISCNRDDALIEGFNPSIKLRRTQTIMEGAAFCDFRFDVE